MSCRPECSLGTRHHRVVLAGGRCDRLGDAVAISLHFNSRIDRARSKLTLLAPNGATQALTPAANAPADELKAEATRLSGGAWRLRWQVLSVDGHITRGDIPFIVH